MEPVASRLRYFGHLATRSDCISGPHFPILCQIQSGEGALPQWRLVFKWTCNDTTLNVGALFNEVFSHPFGAPSAMYTPVIRFT